MLEVMSTSVYTGLNPFNFIRHHSSTGLYRTVPLYMFSHLLTCFFSPVDTPNATIYARTHTHTHTMDT